MAQISISGSELHIRLTLGEKVAALRGDLRVPLSRIAAVGVEQHPFEAVRGVRAPGVAIPRRTAIGTWQHRSGTDVALLHGSGPAVRIELVDSVTGRRRLRRVFVSSEDASTEVDILGRALARRG